MLASLVARLSGSRFGFLSEGGNSAGAWLAGAVPHRRAGGAAGNGGMDWRRMVAAGLKGYVVLHAEPELDCIEGAAAHAALTQAEGVVAVTPYADVLLPLALFPETAGTLVNAEGRWQSFNGCAAAPGETRPGWKVLRVLGNLCDLEGFDYEAADEVRRELEAACSAVLPSSKLEWQAPAPALKMAAPLSRVVDYPIYAVDGMVRRSAALQQTPDATAGAARLNAATAAHCGVAAATKVQVTQGGGSCVLPLVLDERVPNGCVQVPAGLAATSALGAVDAAIELKAAE
jgi:NADH-quinone oxidoreductase subunit G